MTRRLILLVVSAMTFGLATNSMAQGGGGVSVTGGVGDGFLTTAHMFFYSDNSSLGSEALNDGSAVFTRLDMQYNQRSYFSGIGLFYEQDKFGGDETDTAMGLVLELFAGNFFLKFMPGYIEQSFTGRSFSKRAGDFLAIELGIRGRFIGPLFYEVALQRRTQTIKQEDGRDMSSQFEKTETMPILAGGINI